MMACINEDFYMGSMLPQMHWAKSKDMPVLIMNPNCLAGIEDNKLNELDD
jgi:hypothetical protein